MSQNSICTARLMLRVGKLDDAAALATALGDQKVAEQLSRVPWPYTRNDAERFIAGMTRDYLPRFLIFERRDEKEALVGGVGVTRGGDAIKIGYWVARRAWGLGIATEAVGAFLDHLRAEGWESVLAEHKPDNAASARVLDKLGFTICKNAPDEAKSQSSLVLLEKRL
ncbi:MAG: GNAT family N-acetyltransferase [Pseudomonadota bacterium]